MNPFWKIVPFLYLNKWRWVGCVFELISFILGFNAISTKAQIGRGTRFEHRGLGCVISSYAHIESDCVIFQNVTIGSRWKNEGWNFGVLLIGDNVVIGVGAVILRNIRIENGITIGAKDVVINDMPDNCVAVGVSHMLSRKQYM